MGFAEGQVSGTSPIDQVKLAGLRQELGAHFPRILNYFAEDGAKSIDALEDAVRARSAAAMVRPAHTLKGDSLQLGAVPLGMAAEFVEKVAREAVEDQNFPFDMVKHVVTLRPLFEEALAGLQGATGVTLDGRSPTPPAAPAAPVRRGAGGFGRKVA
jgi:histidine phosphotransfer protein HptB